jgi:hypothetical protein
MLESRCGCGKLAAQLPTTMDIAFLPQVKIWMAVPEPRFTFRLLWDEKSVILA